MFLIYAKRVLALQRELDEYLHCASTSQKVRLGATVTVGTCVISPIHDKLVMICSVEHSFFGRSSVSLKEASQYPIIFREQGSGTRAQIEKEFHERGLPINIVWDCYNTEAIINGVADNHGISIISERLIRDAVRQGKLWACPVEDADFDRSFDLVYHKGKYITPILQEFIDICIDFGENPK